MADLPILDEWGFTGGRDNVRPFADRVFTSDAPRFFRSLAGELVVVRNKDLQRFAAMPEIGAVPPAVLFGPAFSADPGAPAVPGSGIAGVISNQAFTANAPIHKPVRKAIVSQLGPKQVKAMEPVAHASVAALLDEIDPGSPVDVVETIAERLTCEFWGRMLGMTPDERRAMEGHVRNLTPMFFLQKTFEDLYTFDEAAKAYRRIIEAAAARSLREGNQLVLDLASSLAEIDLADDPGFAGVVPKDVASLLAGNLVDGFHTAALAAANTIFVLSRHPDILADIDASRELLPNAIFEALRLEPPVIFLNRWCLEDIVVDDLRIPRGTVVTMMWGVGGYDPAAFPDPAAFVHGRSRQGSTTFGGGSHICPGRHVAVMLTSMLVDGLLQRRWLQGASAGEATWYPAHVMSQLKRFDLDIPHAR